MSDRANHDIALHRDFERSDLDQLSDADIEVLEAVWKEFGHMDQWQLSDYTHKHCHEWKNPDGSVLPIDVQEVLQHLGWDPLAAAASARAIQTEHDLDRVFARPVARR
jgi:hypothetical protein